MPLYMDGNSVSVFSKLIVEGGSGGGTITPDSAPITTISVVNKTGSTINEGDKVWLNENVQSADTSYIVSNDNRIINQTGFVSYGNNGTYSLDAEEATLLNSDEFAPYNIYYTDSGNIYTTTSSSGGIGSVYITAEGQVVRKLPSINTLGYNVTSTNVYKYNTNTQEIEQTWSGGYGDKRFIAMVDDIIIIYDAAYASNRYKKLNDDGTVSSLYSFGTYKNGHIDSYYKNFGMTLDCKYIFTSGAGVYTTSSLLKMTEYYKADNGAPIFIGYTQEQMPVDLQKYYVSKGFYTFNPKNGILAACVDGEQTYDIVKYENETWTKLPIQLNLEEGETFESAITLSEDLTRACARTTNGAKIFNLTDLDGYTAISYNPSVVNAQSLTGIASSTAEPNETVTVSVPVEL